MNNRFSIFFTTCFTVLVLSVYSQHQVRNIDWDGTEREYLEYVPAAYNPENPSPVIFALHGLGDNMNNFSGIRFDNVADTTGCIIITPQALMAFFGTMPIGEAWNTGASLYGITPNEDVDDTGFIMAILDSLENHYNIDSDRIFVTGFSMGGYMSNRLAAEAGDRIKAIASVAGTFGVNFNPEPEYNVSVLHIHGTNDNTVEYTGNQSGMDAENLVEFWINFNNCDENPIVTHFPIIVEDGISFERYLYLNGDNNTKVGFIKAIGGAHSWYFTPGKDIDYTTEIWRFFSDQMLYPTKKQEISRPERIEIFPNPATNFINIMQGSNFPGTLYIYDIAGTEIKSTKLTDHQNTIDISFLPAGKYLFRIIDGSGKVYDEKVVKTE